METPEFGPEPSAGRINGSTAVRLSKSMGAGDMEVGHRVVASGTRSGRTLPATFVTDGGDATDLPGGGQGRPPPGGQETTAS
jgi:hypothetical protein